MNQFKYDKQYWPSCGTVVSSMPADLNDLWDTHAGQAKVFVAEAILADEGAGLIVCFEGGVPTVTDFIWGVGGDTITRNADLSELIVDAAETLYEEVLSDEQADDVREQKSALDKIETATTKARERFDKLLSAYEGKRKVSQ